MVRGLKKFPAAPTPNNNAMHAKPDLRVFLKWLDYRFRLGDRRRYVANRTMNTRQRLDAFLDALEATRQGSRQHVAA